MLAAAALLTACGRVGFDGGVADGGVADGGVGDGDGTVDAFVPFVEPTGTFDPTFGTAGTIEIRDGARSVEVFDLVSRAGGYIAIAVHRDDSNSSHMGMFGVTDGGALDAAFGTAGIADVGPTGNDYVYAGVQIAPDRFALAGDGDDASGTQDDMTVAVVDGTGAVIPSFGGTGYARVDASMGKGDTLNAVTFAGGKIVACGGAAYDQTNSHFGLLRFLLDGSLDPTWGTAGVASNDFRANGSDDECLVVIPRPGGGVFAGGTSDGRFSIVAFTDAGVPDPTWAAGGYFAGVDGYAYGLAIVDGDLIAVGEENSESYAVRFDAATGALRPAFGTAGVARFPGVVQLFDSIAVQPNGKLILAGLRDQTAVFLRLDATGAIDSTFGTAGRVEMTRTGTAIEFTRVILEPSGHVLAAGRVGTVEPFYGVVTRLE